ncbi:rab binding domain-containing protein [Ditylenchus destructor]|uniref:Rab binding domain-containing protein n=1 Tax=Ditylenchus destructor TaxID=166010 RepID=A0AAD4N6T4_9BILA|nr:rab binding domain-containing protein [Ditylenchus destructor]
MEGKTGEVAQAEEVDGSTDCSIALAPTEPLSVSTEQASPNTNAGNAVQTATVTSKLDTMSREDLIRLVKKQLITVSNTKKQLEAHKNEADTKQQKIDQLLLAANKSSGPSKENGTNRSTDMISMELSDYKRSLEAVKEQLKESNAQVVAKEALLTELSTKIETLTEERETYHDALKKSSAEMSKLKAILEEKSNVISENSRQIDGLMMQMTHVKSSLEGEISDLNLQLVQHKRRLTEEQKVDNTKTAEIRRLKAENDQIQRRFDDLEQEYRTFKERAEYVLKQQSNDSEDSKQISHRSTVASTEIQQLIETLADRNEKISQLTARCSYLSEDLHTAQEHIKTLSRELDDLQQSVFSSQTREQTERRGLVADYEQRLRQAYAQIDQLKTEKRMIEDRQNAEKAKLMDESNQRFEQLLQQNNKLSEDLSKAKAESAVQSSYNTNQGNARQEKTTGSSYNSQRKPVQPVRPSFLDFQQQQRQNFNQDDSVENEFEEKNSESSDDLQSVLNDPCPYGNDSQQLAGVDLASVLSAGLEEQETNLMDERHVQEIYRQLEHTRELLCDAEESNVKLMEQVKILKEEIRRLERNQEREKHIENSSEYFKNVMLKFLAPEKVAGERQQLLPILRTMLKLSPEECAEVENYIKTSSQVSPTSENDQSGGGGDWTGYFGSLAGIF